MHLDHDIDGDLLEHLDDPCPLGCSDNDFLWRPIEVGGVGSLYAYDCATCGYFVVASPERERLLRREPGFAFGELRNWVRSENDPEPPSDIRRWPWLTEELLLLFGRKMMLA